MDIFQSGKTKMAELAADDEAIGDLNEATTRLRYIDAILRDALGWLPREITTERYESGEYVDYEVGKPSTVMIVEAKRQGITFDLPAGMAGRRSVDIPTLCLDPKTKDAIEQVTRYCQARGVPLGVIANGHQLVAFYASRQDGKAPFKGQALVFSSLQEMHDDFEQLWAFLSRDGIAARNLQRVLLGAQNRPLPPPKLSEQIYNYPGFRTRTEMDTDLKILGGLFIQDIEDTSSVTDDFVRECYCTSGALSQYALVSKEILRARYSAMADAVDVDLEPVSTKRGNNPKLTADVMTAGLSRKPIILVGDVGVGKTMFLQHLVRVDAAKELSTALVLYVDFGREPAFPEHLEAHTARRLIEQIQDQVGTDIDADSFVRSVYNREINQFRKGIYGPLASEDPPAYRRAEIEHLSQLTSDRTEHIRRCLEHLRATRQIQAVIILDNIDQRPGEFQDRVFLIAQSTAETWPATVFVALRPATFYASRSSGSLNAYQLRVFTVSPTRPDAVISRRLQFARKQVRQSTEQDAFPANLSLTGTDMIAYLDSLIAAFESNEALNSMLDNLSGGNLRLALTFLSSFVGSGYVSTRRVLDIANAGGTYKVPPHEFLRSIIRGDLEHFDPAASEICNLLDVFTDDGREHFLLPILLASIQRTGETGDDAGYVPVEDVYEVAQTAGFSQEQAGPHLERALRKNLIAAHLDAGLGGPLRITSTGSYMYKRMLSNFTYIDAMIVDTPIVDVETRRRIVDAKPIYSRLSRAELFTDYLDDQWEKLAGEHNLPFDWPSASATLRADIANVRERADAAAGKRAADEPKDEDARTWQSYHE